MPRKKQDPKKGTGKKPKGSGRRLYTDENPKDTVSIKFATPADARAKEAPKDATHNQVDKRSNDCDPLSPQVEL